jgi:tRNA modification GTPase
MNALAGFERAIVSPQPGTTRDVVTLLTAIDGWPVQLADTAGMRTTQDELEMAGVELAQTAHAAADLVIHVRDGNEPEVASQLHFNGERRLIRVHNKVDLLPPDARRRANVDLFTSALTGEGIEALAAAIGAALVPNPPPPKSAVPFTSVQCKALSLARGCVEQHDGTAALAALQSLLAPRV